MYHVLAPFHFLSELNHSLTLDILVARFHRRVGRRWRGEGVEL